MNINGIQEADGSIPFSSTKKIKGLATAANPFFALRGGD
jgi:hypothetical protein